MIIAQIQRDVFKAIENRKGPMAVMHGCNTQGVMGSGVAKVVKERWPFVYESYRQMCNNDSIDVELGGVMVIPHKPRLDGGEAPVYVANALTQEDYGRDGKRYASVDAVKQSLDGIHRTFKDRKDEVEFVAVRVGCGLGGLDWEDEVEPLFEESPLAWTIYYL